MSKRSKFTNALALLLLQMDSNKDVPILDFVKRSKEEQKRLFEAGLSKCDGERVLSKHQVGCAADIYLLDQAGSLIDWKNIPDKAKYYHDFWETLGGNKIIPWDVGHFEWL